MIFADVALNCLLSGIVRCCWRLCVAACLMPNAVYCYALCVVCRLMWLLLVATGVCRCSLCVAVGGGCRVLLFVVVAVVGCCCLLL